MGVAMWVLRFAFVLTHCLLSLWPSISLVIVAAACADLMLDTGKPALGHEDKDVERNRVHPPMPENLYVVLCVFDVYSVYTPLLQDKRFIYFLFLPMQLHDVLMFFVLDLQGRDGDPKMERSVSRTGM